MDASLLAAIVDSSDGAVVSTAPDGTILSWNQAAERIYGWPADHAIGVHIGLIVPADLMSEHVAHVASVLGGDVVRRVETERITRGGERIPVAFTMSPVLGPDGSIIATAAITRDMSEQRWMAQTLDTTLAALETAVEEAKASEERSRAFLADAAHQLRAPMAGIQACAETLLRGVPPEAADKLLASMVRETSRAARLVTSLQQIARLDAGEPIAIGPCDVVAVCEDEVLRARGLAPQLDVRLVVIGDIPEMQFDPKVLHEIVANLVDNARRHAVATVGLHAQAKGGVVTIRVADDGPGVPQDMRE